MRTLDSSAVVVAAVIEIVPVLMVARFVLTGVNDMKRELEAAIVLARDDVAFRGTHVETNPRAMLRLRREERVQW